MTPVDRVLAALERLDCHPRRSGGQWSACCPSHEDRRPSLSVGEGDDGRALVTCHAGCPTETVCGSLGMEMADLMPEVDWRTASNVNVNGTDSRRAERQVSMTADGESGGKIFPTAEAALQHLERKHGPRSALWEYHGPGGLVIGLIVRWDLGESEKDIRPISQCAGGWRIGGMRKPRLLYGLQQLSATSAGSRVYVCEGEKAADAARSIGLTATTSAHGSNAADMSDWQPLAGMEVIILPDNDQPGGKYAAGVARILSQLSPPAVVKIVELPGLPTGGDLVDWIDSHGDACEPEELRRQLEALADAAAAIKTSPPAVTLAIPSYQPFPVDALPEPLRGFVTAGAKAIGCDPSYIALPLLTALAAAIGNSRRLLIRPGWFAPPIIWSAIIGESGTAKTPAFGLVMRPIVERQENAFDRHAEQMRNYEIDLARHDAAMTDWRKKGAKDNAEPPIKPEMPEAERLFVDDSTVEAIAVLLRANPRGLLLSRDELAGWFGSFNQYKGGKGGADESHWLKMFNAQPLAMDRKTGPRPTIYIPNAAVCICGGIQPAILRRALGREHRESGLAARFLLAWPPRKAKKWPKVAPDAANETVISALVDRLYELRPLIDESGKTKPICLPMTPDAEETFGNNYDRHGQEQLEHENELAAAWSKLEEYPARIALVLHFARWAADDPTLESADRVDLASMTAAIRLVTWFKGEAKRVYAMLNESAEDQMRRKLAEWISQRGGVVTARDVQAGFRALRESGAAEMALRGLVQHGYGEWQDRQSTSKGGRPTSEFVLQRSTEPP